MALRLCGEKPYAAQDRMNSAIKTIPVLMAVRNGLRLLALSNRQLHDRFQQRIVVACAVSQTAPSMDSIEEFRRARRTLALRRQFRCRFAGAVGNDGVDLLIC